MSACRNPSNNYTFFVKEVERRQREEARKKREEEIKRQEIERQKQERERLIQAQVNTAVRLSGISQLLEADRVVEDEHEDNNPQLLIEAERILDDEQEDNNQNQPDRNCSTTRCSIQ